MKAPDIDAVLAYIAEANWQSLQRITAATSVRLPDVTAPTFTAKSVADQFKVGMTVEIVGTTDRTINGKRFAVGGISGTKVVVLVAGARWTMPPACCIPVDGPPTPDAETPVGMGDFVRLSGPAALKDAIAVVHSRSKNGRLTFTLIDGTARTLTGPPEGLTRVDGPKRGPHLTLFYKQEEDKYGAVTLIDTGVSSSTEIHPFGATIEGQTKFGWLKRSEAQVIARAYKATFEEA